MSDLGDIQNDFENDWNSEVKVGKALQSTTCQVINNITNNLSKSLLI